MEDKNMKKYISIVLFSALFLGLNSCQNYLDINYDPNSPAEENLTNDMIIPAVEMNIAATYAYTLHILGAYNVQYYAQQFGTPNYVEYSKFHVSAENGSGVYTQLFQRALGNLELARKKATEAGENGMFLQATVLRASAYQLLVDAFGEVPYTEAFDVDNFAPKYDDGQVIYEGLIKEIDEALAKAEAGDAVATSYIFPNGTAADWIKFANAQKLKMLTRMSGVADVASEIKALIDENNFPGDVQLAGCWSNASGQANPFFSEEGATWGRATHNVIGNLALLATMNQSTYVDPRLAKWFSANESGVYQGSISGSNLSTVEDKYKSTAVWCPPVLEYNTPVILLGKTEVEFFIAEYFARQSDATNAAAHYQAAVEASFATAGVAGADACVAKFPYDQSKWQEVIGVAKWVALGGINGFESYTEARRLDYPQFGTVTATDMYPAGKGALDLSLYVPGTLYTPYQRFDQVGDNKLLERFPYPESSTSRNSNAPEFPGYLTPIFWGK